MKFSTNERLERHKNKAHTSDLSRSQIKKNTWGITKTRKSKNRNVGS